ncbi:hypothetical protein [Rhodanobacter sp. DHB23]|nr:hypothetical protein [Rhodanobacter sp. DHB23]
MAGVIRRTFDLAGIATPEAGILVDQRAGLHIAASRFGLCLMI